MKYIDLDEKTENALILVLDAAFKSLGLRARDAVNHIYDSIKEVKEPKEEQ